MREEEPVPPAPPPEAEPDDDHGDPPDWTDYEGGWLGHYYNLPSDHPDVEPSDDRQYSDGPDAPDWWDEDYLSFERFDASLELGSGWWPVDEGLAGDPDFFSARWTGWVRVADAGPAEILLGAASAVWLSIDGSVLASAVDADRLEAEVVELELTAGQFPVTLHYAHRHGDSGLRLRVLSEHVSQCFASYEG